MRISDLSLQDKSHNAFLKVVPLFVLKIFILYSKHLSHCIRIKPKSNLVYCSFDTELLFYQALEFDSYPVSSCSTEFCESMLFWK